MTQDEAKKMMSDTLDTLDMFSLMGVNPDKDTVASALRKFGERSCRHLMIYAEGCGLFLICANAEMSRRIKNAVDEIDEALDKEETDVQTESVQP